MKIRIMLIVLFVLLAESGFCQSIKVGLTSLHLASFTIACDEPISISNGTDTLTADSALIKSSPEGVSVNGDFCGSRITVSAEKPLRIVAANNKEHVYRGSLEITKGTFALAVINVVDVEDYLRGVVPQEMPATYPTEAIKTQAVAARTYALAAIGKHKTFDICDTTHCQLYRGVGVEKTAADDAVAATKGIVLKYAGKYISAMYCSDCGGETQNYALYYPNIAPPYLCGVREPDGIKHCSWEYEISIDRLDAKLKKARLISAALVDIKICDKTDGGRITNLQLVTETGEVKVRADKLRALIGTSAIKSTLFEINVADGNVSFIGSGYGHGVGMCQAGCKALAAEPFNYTFDKILAHYYPSAVLTLL